jgi:hypothetical protein
MRRAANLRRLLAATALSAACAATVVTAQPVAQAPPPPPSPAAAPAPGAPQVVAPPPAPEEAPPQETVAPPPVVVPPITEKEIEPAPEPPAAEAKPAAPLRRARYDVAILQALDKVTAESMVFAAPVGKRIRYKGLIITVRTCERSTPDEPVEDWIAYLDIASQARAEAGMPAPPARQVFRGWMYASSPGLHPLEHPVYDAWVISCRAAAPSPIAAR